MRAWSLWALAGILFATVLTGWSAARWPASILEVGAFALAFAWVVRLWASGERARLSIVLATPAAFVLLGVAQMALGGTLAQSDTLRSVLAWGASLAIVFAGLQTFTDNHGERFLRILLAGGFAVCVLATLQSFTAAGRIFWLFPVPEPEYLMGPFLNHNHYAAFVELLLPLALIPAMRAPARHPAYVLMAGTLVASVIASASRAGFLLVGAEVLVVTLLCAWKDHAGWKRLMLALTAVVLVAAGLTAVVGWNELWTRLRQPDPFSGRRQMLESSIAMIRDHGLRGVGLGNWPAAYPYYAKYDDGLYANQAHNDWAQWTAEGGIVALAAALVLFAWTLRQTLRTVWCAGPLFVLLHAFVDYPFEKIQITGILFTMLAASAPQAAASPRKSQNTS